jgi:hypothetical protein
VRISSLAILSDNSVTLYKICKGVKILCVNPLPTTKLAHQFYELLPPSVAYPNVSPLSDHALLEMTAMIISNFSQDQPVSLENGFPTWEAITS